LSLRISSYRGGKRKSGIVAMGLFERKREWLAVRKTVRERLMVSLWTAERCCIGFAGKCLTITSDCCSLLVVGGRYF